MSVEDIEKYEKNTISDSDKFGGCVDGGQPLTSLQGVDVLTGLSELWVVECKLEGMDEISTCTNLKKLYLYSNNIKTIPELQGLKNLEVLWLSSNQIQTLKKVNVPNNIKDLHLADNNIPSIPNSCFSDTKLVSLNISGNPFKNFKVLHSLTHISTLQNLVLSDPIHNSCPVCYRNNYRTFTIYSLPQIASLDHIIITKDERKLTDEYYKDILFYYRILKNQLLTQHYVEYMNIHKNMHSSLEMFRKKIFDMVQVRHITLSMYPEGSAAKKEPDIDFELNKQFLLDDASRAVTNSTYDLTANDCRLKIELYKLEYELKSAGRIMFKNFTKDSVLGNISQKLLSEFSCSYLKSTIKVKPQELGVTYIFSADCPQFVEEDSNLNFFIVCSPVSVTELDVRLYSYIDQIINETLDEGILLTVTNCLVAADRLLMDSSAIESVLVCSSSIPRLSLVVYVKDTNTLVESNLSGCHSSTKGHGGGDCKCNKYLVHSYSVVPAFIIEYNYIKETFKSNHTQNINIISVKYCNSNREESSSDTFSRTEKTTVESVLQQPLWSTMDLEQLTELDISSSHIGSFGKIRSQLINVKHLDLSYNNLSTLQDVPNIFPNVVNINASFNVINCISFAKSLPNLEVLDVSWNRISRLVILLLQLKNSTPIIWELDVRYNPVLDIHNSNHIDHFVRKYLSELSHFNGKFIKAAESTSIANVDTFIHASSFNGTNNILTLEWLNSLCCLPPDRKYIGSGPHLGFNSDKKLTCLSAKGQYNFNFALSTNYNIESIQYVDLSSIGLDNVHCLRLIHRLVELNLSDNLLRYIGSFVCNMNYLVRLNLSYNYLNSMKEICDSSLSSLKILDISFNQISSLSGLESCPNLIELYATHNSLNDLEALCTLKNLRKLRTVALNYNEVEKCERFRLFLIYHLHHLEFINGVKIVEEEEITANEEFSGVIDSDHLLKEHNGIQLPHITKLVLSKCNIKDVCLDEKCLINLKVLDLEYNNITCLKGLATLPSLEILNLGYNRVTSLGIQCKPSSLGYVNKLSTFSTSTVNSYFETDDDAACVVVGNTNALSNTDNEKENNPKINKNQSSYQGQHKSVLFPELKVLALHSNHIISLIPFQFSSFRKLNTLMVQDNFITNLSGLQGVRHLRCLILDKNKITSNAIVMEDIEDISSTLTDLYLENNSLRNIKFIKQFTNLKKLYLAQNRIKDQQEIRQLESLNLQELTLWGNAVSRLCNYHYLVLESLPDLRRFDGVHLQNYE